MRNWTETKKPAYMDVAFSAERSIEDELERTSHSDVGTILISYIIMFAYIAISLGQIRSFSRLLVSVVITTEVIFMNYNIFNRGRIRLYINSWNYYAFNFFRLTVKSLWA